MLSHIPHLKKFVANSDGATAIEMAILAPVFLAFVFGVIEFARVQWSIQSMEDASFFSARCSATAQSICDTDQKVKTFAVAEAKKLGFSIKSSDVLISKNVDCNNTNSHQITMTYTTNSPVRGLVPKIPESVSVTSCFPAPIVST